MIKLLHFTDPHSEDDYIFSKFGYVRDVAKAEKVDGVLCGGDFLDDFDLPNMQAVYHGRHSDLVKLIPEKDSYCLDLDWKVENSGGYEKLLMSGNAGLMRLAQGYAFFQSDIISAKQRNADRLKMNEVYIEISLNNVRKKLEPSNRLRCAVLDKIFGEMNCPVYAVPGNHDVDSFVNYDWKNLKFLDDIADVKGLKIAAAPNWYELAGVPFDFKGMEQDIFHGGNVGEKSHELDDILNYLRQQYPEQEVRELINQQIASTSVFQRLYGKQFDVLLTHKGPHSFATETRNEGILNFGSGAGLEAIIEQAKPKTILMGHVHVPLVATQKVSDDYSYQGLRGSPNEFFVDYFDDNTKHLAKFESHKWSDAKKKAA